MDGYGKKIVTMKDVAIKTGFTVNTVSRVLNNKENIAAQTRENILTAAKELGYVGNSLAGSLRSGMSGTIAIIISDVSNPLFGIMVKEIDTLLRKHNYCVFVLNTDEKSELEEKAIFLALSKKVDGVIICPTQGKRAPIELFNANGVPYVLMGRRFEGYDDNYVIWDDTQGGYLATSHLISKGHRDILFINGPQYISSAHDRLEGYKKALLTNNISFDYRLVKQVNLTSKNVHKFVSQTIDAGINFTSIFAFNDLMAFATINALQDIGRKVPEDIAVVGFDNIQSKLSLPFPLTTVSTPKTKMASKVVEILIRKIKSQEITKASQNILETSLVIRRST